MNMKRKFMNLLSPSLIIKEYIWQNVVNVKLKKPASISYLWFFYIKVMICHTWFTLPKHGPRGLESPDPPDGGLGQPQHRLAVTSGHRRRGRKLGQRQQLDRVFWILSLCWSPSWLQPQRSGITAIPTRGESHHSNIVSIWHLMGCHRLTSYQPILTITQNQTGLNVT